MECEQRLVCRPGKGKSGAAGTDVLASVGELPLGAAADDERTKGMKRLAAYEEKEWQREQQAWELAQVQRLAEEQKLLEAKAAGWVVEARAAGGRTVSTL